ncbi:hypothetical protein QL285_076112 [Trifolium repens]|nr:hypothetical protein QL285_076112 [Trifolium repens]
MTASIYWSFSLLPLFSRYRSHAQSTLPGVNQSPFAANSTRSYCCYMLKVLIVVVAAAASICLRLLNRVRSIAKSVLSASSISIADHAESIGTDGGSPA